MNEELRNDEVIEAEATDEEEVSYLPLACIAGVSMLIGGVIHKVGAPLVEKGKKKIKKAKKKAAKKAEKAETKRRKKAEEEESEEEEA